MWEEPYIVLKSTFNSNYFKTTLTLEASKKK